MKHPKIHELTNGVRIVAIPLKERKSVSVGVWVAQGARHEDPKLSGISHFLEHMVFKGTKKRSTHQIKQAVEGVGGSLNAFTSEECTCYFAKSASRYFDQVLDVLADMTFCATLTKKDVEKERTVILEEIKMTQDQPSQLADEHLTSILWSGHALGRPIAGTLETVSQISENDLARYRDTYYRPNQIVVVASGDITEKELLSATRKKIGSKTGRARSSSTVYQNRPSVMRHLIESKKTEQTHVTLGFKTFGREHADQYALDLLSVVMGGNMSSRLFNEVREERGLAYDIGSYVRRFQETGSFIVSAGVDSSKACDALEIVWKELVKISNGAPAKDELKRAKEFYLGQLDLGLESTMTQMMWAGDAILSHNRLKSYDEIAEKISRVTARDISRVAKDIFSLANAHLAAVGPMEIKQQKKLTQVLNLN